MTIIVYRRVMIGGAMHTISQDYITEVCSIYALASSSTLKLGGGAALAARGGLSRSSLCGCLDDLLGELRGEGGLPPLAFEKPRCCSYSS